MTDGSFAGNSYTIKTEEGGNTILPFIGRRPENGHIKSERFTGRLQKYKEGNALKTIGSIRERAAEP